MKLSETTFRDTPNEIVLNRLHATGLDYTETSSNFTTGGLESRKGSATFNENHMSEGVFSAYVLMNLDVAPSGTQ